MKRNDQIIIKTARAAAVPRQSSGTTTTTSPPTSDSPSTSDRTVKLTDEHSNVSSDTPLARWLRNGGAQPTSDGTGLSNGMVLWEIITADCIQHEGDMEAMIRSVSVPIIDLSEKEGQRVLGDTTYYVEWLKNAWVVQKAHG